MAIGPNKERVWLTLDKDVLAKAREYATRITLSSMVNAMLAEALGDPMPRPLKSRLPKIAGEDDEE